MVVPLDSSVNIAFPYMTDHFAIGVSDTKLIVISFILTSISLLLIAGRAGDVWGHRLVFQAGLVISAVGLALVALAPTFPVLLAARVLQGTGGALLIGSSPALAIGLFPENRRGLVIGAYAMMFAVGTAGGPIIGGFLIDAWDWQAVYWYRVPIALAALILSPLLTVPASGPEKPPAFDFGGAIMLGVAIAALFIALNLAWDGGLSWAVFAVIAAIAFALFVRRQIHFTEPIIDLALFHRPWFSGFAVASLLINLAAFSIMLLTPFYLRRISGLGAAEAGLILASFPAGLAVAALATGRLLGRLDLAPANGKIGGGARPPARAQAARLLLFAPLVTGSGLWLIGGWSSATGTAAMLAAMVLTGVGLGIFQAAYFYIVTDDIPPANRGVAGSLAELTRSAGNLAAATLFFEIFRILSASSSSGDGDFLAGYQATLHWAAAISILVFVLVFIAGWGQRVGAKSGPPG